MEDAGRARAGEQVKGTTRPRLAMDDHQGQRGRDGCGAGRDRTAVQTTGQWAFYMRSRFIGFRSLPGEGHPSKDLGPVSYLRSGPPRRPVFQGDTPGPGRRMTGLPEGYSSTLLLFTWIKPIALGY